MRFVRKMTAERKDNRCKLSQMYDMFIKKITIPTAKKVNIWSHSNYCNFNCKNIENII